MRFVILLVLVGLSASMPTGEMPNVDVKQVMASAADAIGNLDVKGMVEGTVEGMSNVNVKQVMASAADAIGNIDVKGMVASTGTGAANVKAALATAADAIGNIDVKGMVASTTDNMGTGAANVKAAMATAADAIGNINVKEMMDGATGNLVNMKEAMADGMDGMGEVNVKQVLATFADSIGSLDIKGMVADNVETMNNIASAKGAILQYTGEALGEAAVAAKTAAFDYAGEVDAMAAIDKAEASVLASKTAAITGVFDAKRKLVQGLQKARDDHKENLKAMLEKTVSGLNVAINTTGQAFTVTKETVSDYTEEVTMQNAKTALANALNTTLSMIETTSTSLIGALVATKMKLHSAAANFDSFNTYQGAHEGIGSTISASFEKTGEAADHLGIFKLIDGLVKSLADVPIKINQILVKAEVDTQLGVQKAVEETVQELEEIVEERENELEEMEKEVDAVKEEMMEVKEEMEMMEEDPVVDVKITVNGDVILDETSLENEIMEAISARISPVDRFDRDTATPVVHVSLLQPSPRSATIATMEEDRITVRVTVNSNVELDDSLEDDVIRVVQERIVRETGNVDENERPDMVIQVNVNQDNEEGRDSKDIEE